MPEKMNNILVSCIYRKPGSSIDPFLVNMGNLFPSIEQKVIYICGDFKIDLLNPNNNTKTEQFSEVMHNMGVFPKITKTTRILSYCVTLINNIFFFFYCPCCALRSKSFKLIFSSLIVTPF